MKKAMLRKLLEERRTIPYEDGGISFDVDVKEAKEIDKEVKKIIEEKKTTKKKVGK